MGHNVNCLSGASLKNSFNSRWNPAFGGWRWWELSKYVTIIFFLLNQHLESMDFLFDPSKVFSQPLVSSLLKCADQPIFGSLGLHPRQSPRRDAMSLEDLMLSDDVDVCLNQCI